MLFDSWGAGASPDAVSACGAMLDHASRLSTVVRQEIGAAAQKRLQRQLVVLNRAAAELWPSAGGASAAKTWHGGSDAEDPEDEGPAPNARTRLDSDAFPW